MIDVNPTDSDSMRELRRIGPIAQALFTVVFAVAACILALVLMGSSAIPAAPVPASVPQKLAAAPTTASDGVGGLPGLSSTDVQPEPLPPTF